MARQLYAVNWSDAAWPRIVPVESVPGLDASRDGVTLTAAKAEIIDYWSALVAHGRDQILAARRLRVADVLAADGGEW